MKKILTILFPYKIHLNILQIDHYYIMPFLKWISKNFFKRNLEGKMKLQWTFKSRLLLSIAIFYILIDIVLLTIFFSYIGFAIGLILSTQSYIYLSLAQLTLIPLEYYKTKKIKTQTQKKILQLKKEGLQIIGITGSSGKTTTKQFLYHILKSKYKVLRTPESYNTVLGIAQVVDLELTKDYDFFIVEMGAYGIGQIKEICDMVLPDHGILTNIGTQHLERFGSIENTTQAKFELIESIPEDKYALANFDNDHIAENYKRFRKSIIKFGFKSDQYTIQNIDLSEEGSNFELMVGENTIEASTKILGKHNLSNILAASTLANLLDIDNENLKSAIKTLKPVPHRLELKTLDENNLLIDNAYNSNFSGFKADLDVIAQFKDRKKIIVTPGIVEQGEKTKEIHLELGKKINKICDYVFLVGKTEMTKYLAQGIGDKSKIKRLETVSVWLDEVKKLDYEKTIILLENDLPDNY